MGGISWAYWWQRAINERAGTDIHWWTRRYRQRLSCSKSYFGLLSIWFPSRNEIDHSCYDRIRLLQIWVAWKIDTAQISAWLGYKDCKTAGSNSNLPLQSNGFEDTADTVPMVQQKNASSIHARTDSEAASLGSLSAGAISVAPKETEASPNIAQPESLNLQAPVSSAVERKASGAESLPEVQEVMSFRTLFLPISHLHASACLRSGNVPSL